MLREIKTELGFDLIELDNGISGSLMPGIQKVFETGEIRFSSLHDCCSVSAGSPATSSDCSNFSAASPEEREGAVTQAFQAIDLARQLNAPFVVLHLGRINMPPITDRLIAMAKAGKYLSREYVRMKINAVQEREKIAPECLERVKNCLHRVIEYAAAKNVRIGFEARPDYEQIPTERELTELLDEMNSPYVGYWHDFGHSQIKENLGFIDHAEWLRTVGPRAFGCHVQDCIWPARDQQPPFTGGVDFEKLVPLLPTNCLFVWKMNPNKTADAIRQSVQMWKERFGE
ncbi:MAG: sugar phosphate isomerase/epimerase [Verrucomicrobia bacterium]|nr:sugar phosphate isomerase/epimerase [Verrucomicrobiota bacterium]